MDVGRRYVDKPDFLPLNEVVEWLEKLVAEHSQHMYAETRGRNSEKSALPSIPYCKVNRKLTFEEIW